MLRGSTLGSTPESASLRPCRNKIQKNNTKGKQKKTMNEALDVERKKETHKRLFQCVISYQSSFTSPCRRGLRNRRRHNGDENCTRKD